METPATQASATPLTPGTTKPSVQHLRYLGTGGAILVMGLKHALLTIVTFGIYAFWARNNMRVFHYSHTELGGEPFSYHGTGGELFKGSIKAGLIIFGISFLFALVPSLLLGETQQTVQIMMALALYPVVIGLSLAAVVLARRYRFSRSSWRGIRFSYHGRVGEYIPMVIKGVFLSVITLGFYSPRFANERRAFLVNNTRYGTEPFIYEGTARPLYGEFIKAFLLTIPTLFLSWIWYGAFVQRYQWSQTRVAGARFLCTVTGGGLLSLHVTNLLLVVFTLGIGTPWAIARMHQYAADNLVMRGAPDWAAIHQRAEAAGATGEGLAEGLDIDVGLGI